MYLPRIIAIAAAGLLLGACSSPPSAPVVTTTSTPAATTVSVSSTPLQQLNQFTLADLQAALADAQAQTPPDYSAACWSALIAWLPQLQAQQLLPAKPGLFALLQKARDAKGVVTTGVPSAVHVACAPVVLDAETTVAQLGALVGVKLVAPGVPVVPTVP